jgi:hypothetical protein
MSTAHENPLFTRSEKGRFGRTMKKRARGAARKGLSKIFGIPLSKGLGGASPRSSRRSAHRSGTTGSPASSVRSDVISALRGQGYNAGTAKKMAEGVLPGDSFDSAFRRVLSRNPGELIIFGNPSMAYTRKGVLSAKRAGNPIPAAILQAFEGSAGSKLFDELTSGKKKRNSFISGTTGKRCYKPGAHPRLKKKNPAGEDGATELFEKFHHRGAEGTFDRQRSARLRKDYTILGPLVAIGINAEKFDSIAARAGRGWEDYVVENYDKLPRLDFMTPGQVEDVKRILGDPGKYVQECPLLASSPSGRQLDTDTQKDYVDLGDATFVVYIAKKPHEVREWVHVMGEDGGTRPRLMYDRLRKEVCFIGGSYVVKAPGIMH